MQQGWEPTLSMIQLTEAQAARPQPPIDSATLSDPLPKMTLPFSTASINCPVLDSSMMSFNRSSNALQNQGCSEPFLHSSCFQDPQLVALLRPYPSKMIKHENKDYKDIQRRWPSTICATSWDISGHESTICVSL